MNKVLGMNHASRKNARGSASRRRSPPLLLYSRVSLRPLKFKRCSIASSMCIRYTCIRDILFRCRACLNCAAFSCWCVIWCIFPFAWWRWSKTATEDSVTTRWWRSSSRSWNHTWGSAGSTDTALIIKKRNSLVSGAWLTALVRSFHVIFTKTWWYQYVLDYLSRMYTTHALRWLKQR